jgi:hypothetical protein
MPNDADNTPTEPAAGSAREPSEAQAVPVYDRPEPKKGRGLVIGIAAAALVIGIGGGFALGRGTASSGPSSLADAIRLSSQGKLARGDVTTALRSSGGFGALGNRNGQGRGGGGGAAGGGGNGRAGGGLQGTIQSIDGNTLTLSTRAGTVKVMLSDKTQITKADPGQQSDLAQGLQVLVRPDLTASSSDGSVSAASIETRPQG